VHISLKSLLTEYIDEVLVEPKRKDPVGISTLVKSGKGVDNIINVYNAATPGEKDYWGNWYHHAKKDVEELTEKYIAQLQGFVTSETPFEVMAAIVAVLSPGNKWKDNYMAAERIMINARLVNAYPKNVKKANFIKLTGDTSLVTGPKVEVFFQSLLDPKSVETRMVLDGHAINIWRGEKLPLKWLKKPSKEERIEMINDYQEASTKLNASVQAIQAVTWYIWKYSSNDLKPAPEVPNIVSDAQVPEKSS
jgi:hypothetical protein